MVYISSTYTTENHIRWVSENSLIIFGIFYDKTNHKQSFDSNSQIFGWKTVNVIASGYFDLSKVVDIMRTNGSILMLLDHVSAEKVHHIDQFTRAPSFNKLAEFLFSFRR